MLDFEYSITFINKYLKIYRMNIVFYIYFWFTDNILSLKGEIDGVFLVCV